MIRHTKNIAVPASTAKNAAELTDKIKSKRLQIAKLMAKLPELTAAGGKRDVAYVCRCSCGDAGDDSDMQHIPDGWELTFMDDTSTPWVDNPSWGNGRNGRDPNILITQDYCRYVYNGELRSMFHTRGVNRYQNARRICWRIDPVDNDTYIWYSHHHRSLIRFFDGSTYEQPSDVPRIRVEHSKKNGDDHDVYVYNDDDDTELYHYHETGKPWLWVLDYAVGGEVC